MCIRDSSKCPRHVGVKEVDAGLRGDAAAAGHGQRSSRSGRAHGGRRDGKGPGHGHRADLRRRPARRR
eukprot:12252014-Alexandrium_andersonii.AAC.1